MSLLFKLYMLIEEFFIRFISFEEKGGLPPWGWAPPPCGSLTPSPPLRKAREKPTAARGVITFANVWLGWQTTAFAV